MKNEADFKTKFKKSIKYHKGFSLSLAAPMLAGIPDLYVVMPEYMPVLLEAKWLGEITRDSFKRKLPFTDLQVEWIKQCHNICAFSAMGLIGFNYQTRIHAVLVTYGTPQFYELNQACIFESPNVVYMTAKYEDNPDSRGAYMFDIPLLFSRVPIPRMSRRPCDPLAEIIKHHPVTRTLALDKNVPL